MNTKDFLRLSVPLGEATRRAMDFVARFILGGGDKSRLHEEVAAIVANPSAFLADELRKDVAKALILTPHPGPLLVRRGEEGLFVGRFSPGRHSRLRSLRHGGSFALGYYLSLRWSFWFVERMHTKDILRLVPLRLAAAGQGVPMAEAARRATKDAPTEDLIKAMNQFFFPLLALLAVAVWQPCYAQVPAAPTARGTAGPVPLSQSHAASERMFNSWKTPLPPRHIIGNIHYVGPAGVSSWLITTPEGHILIDSTFAECVPQICANVEKLGFRVSDIKLLLSSHAHVDHTGGHAAMKGRTGARIVASAADARLLETGGAEDFSPFPKDLLAYQPVKADRIVADGDAVSLGGVTLTAHLTPGHTQGATTWTMPLKDGERTYQVVFFSSVSIAEPTPLLNDPAYPTIAEDYEATFKKLKALPCDIFLAPHADQFGLTAKLRGLEAGANPNPFIDPAGWKAFLANAEQVFRKQLAAEKAAETKRQ